MKRILLVLASIAALVAVVEVVRPSGSVAPAAAAPGDPAGAAEDPVDIEAAIRRGVAYLVASQNKDGSWGSPASNLWDIYAPAPGSYYAFETASSALAVSALLEAGGKEPGVEAAVARGADYLLSKHARAKRITADVLYNVWTQAYAIEAFCRLIDREKDPARIEAYKKAVAIDVDLLGRYEFVDGGWGYYNFNLVTQHPEHGATSFTTATCLAALKMAKDRGVAVPAALVKTSIDLVETCRKPDWAFAYSWEHRHYPQGRINKTKGSLARTPACVEALAAWDQKVPPERVLQALDDLEKYGRFLLIARKYPIPHETWYQNSGYFCFYGYYYASALLARVPAEKKPGYAKQLAGHLVPLQEKDGSWWDYQLYSYHKAYGTGYVLMTLARCR